MIREWKLVQRFTFYLQPNLNRKTLPAILTLQFDDVTVKTIYSSTIEKSASVTQTINLLIIITTLVIYAHFLLSAFFHPHPPSTGTPAVRVLQTPCLELVKHASCTGFVAKSRTSLCFLHDTFSQPEKT